MEALHHRSKDYTQIISGVHCLLLSLRQYPFQCMAEPENLPNFACPGFGRIAKSDLKVSSQARILLAFMVVIVTYQT